MHTCACTHTHTHIYICAFSHTHVLSDIHMVIHIQYSTMHRHALCMSTSPSSLSTYQKIICTFNLCSFVYKIYNCFMQEVGLASLADISASSWQRMAWGWQCCPDLQDPTKLHGWASYIMADWDCCDWKFVSIIHPYEYHVDICNESCSASWLASRRAWQKL